VTRLAVLLWGACVVLAVPTVVLLVLAPGGLAPTIDTDIFAGLGGAAFLLLGLTYASVGGIIARREPAHRIGWIFALTGLLITVNSFNWAFLDVAVRTTHELPGVTWALIVNGVAGEPVAAWVGRHLPIRMALLGLVLASFPIAAGIAILRYGLFEIDRIVSRTISYATVTAVLGAAYVGLVLLGQALFSSFAGGSNLAIAASTLVVAALFLPVRSRVQGFVDRRFYRRRYDAQRTLEGFGARLREQIDLGTLEGDLRSAVSDTMQPTHVTLWRREMHG
jgi:hypothetical protein